ncbi:MAG: hypothetical protein ACO3SP_02470 [Ilumatobacteraceae bacterium]
MLYDIARPFVFRLDPEAAHDLAFANLERAHRRRSLEWDDRDTARSISLRSSVVPAIPVGLLCHTPVVRSGHA